MSNGQNDPPAGASLYRALMAMFNNSTNNVRRRRNSDEVVDLDDPGRPSLLRPPRFASILSEILNRHTHNFIEPSLASFLSAPMFMRPIIPPIYDPPGGQGSAFDPDSLERDYRQSDAPGAPPPASAPAPAPDPPADSSPLHYPPSAESPMVVPGTPSDSPPFAPSESLPPFVDPPPIPSAPPEEPHHRRRYGTFPFDFPFGFPIGISNVIPQNRPVGQPNTLQRMRRELRDAQVSNSTVRSIAVHEIRLTQEMQRQEAASSNAHDRLLREALLRQVRIMMLRDELVRRINMRQRDRQIYRAQREHRLRSQVGQIPQSNPAPQPNASQSGPSREAQPDPSRQAQQGFNQQAQPYYNQWAQSGFYQRARPHLNQQPQPVINQQSQSSLSQQARPDFSQQSQPVINQQPLPVINQQSQSSLNQQTRPGFSQQPQPVINQQSQSSLSQQARPDFSQQPQPVINQQPLPVINQQPLPVINQQARLGYNQQPQPVINQQPLPDVYEMPRIRLSERLYTTMRGPSLTPQSPEERQRIHEHVRSFIRREMMDGRRGVGGQQFEAAEQIRLGQDEVRGQVNQGVPGGQQNQVEVGGDDGVGQNREVVGLERVGEPQVLERDEEVDIIEVENDQANINDVAAGRIRAEHRRLDEEYRNLVQRQGHFRRLRELIAEAGCTVRVNPSDDIQNNESDANR